MSSLLDELKKKYMTPVLLSVCAFFIVTACPLFNSPGYLGSLNTALDNYASPTSSFELDPSLSVSAQLSACNANELLVRGRVLWLLGFDSGDEDERQGLLRRRDDLHRLDLGERAGERFRLRRDLRLLRFGDRRPQS